MNSLKYSINSLVFCCISTTLLICGLSFNLFSQSSGDYRSSGNGNWNVNTNWETYNGSSWVGASVSPDYTNGAIEIVSGHTITVTASLTVDQFYHKWNPPG